jgi:Trypsin-like peptidase domain
MMLVDKQVRRRRCELPQWWRDFNGPEMPLGPYMIHSVVRIVGDKQNKKTGAWERKPLGTGFHVRVPSDSVPDRWYGYVLTAHHVIDGQPRPDLLFPDPYDPGQLYPAVATEGPEWKQPLPRVDLAVLPFARPDGYWINSLQIEMHLRETLPGPAMLAMPFHYVGLLEPLDRAMARSGTLGAIYETGIEHPDGYEYIAHLGDCRSYGGFSGSPCFVELAMPGLVAADPPVEPPPGFDPVGRMHYLHLLCGMVTWHLEPAVERDEASIFGVVCMLTSDDLWKALMSDKLVDKRREADAIQDEPDTRPVSMRKPEDEFDRFEDLTRKLVNTPKPARE